MGGREGLVKGAPEMSVAPPTGQDRIMIHGPKSDGTYIIEFRMADGGVVGDQRAGWRDPRTQAFPGAHALRAIRAGRGSDVGLDGAAFSGIVAN